MQLRTVLDVNVVDVQKRRNPSKHYVSFFLFFLPLFQRLTSCGLQFPLKVQGFVSSYVAAFTVCCFSCQSRYSDHFDPCDLLNFPERTSSDDVWKETLGSTILTRSLFVFHLKQRQVIWSTKANKTHEFATQWLRWLGSTNKTTKLQTKREPPNQNIDSKKTCRQENM